MGKREAPASATKGTRSGNRNHARAHQIHYIGSAPPPLIQKKSQKQAQKAKKKPSSREVSGPTRSSPRKSRLKGMDTKTAILKKYCKWKLAGAKKEESPIPDIVKDHDCAPNYPGRLFKLMLDRGTVDNQWGLGRPPTYTEEVWDEMVKIIRDYRDEQQEYASGSSIRKELSFVFSGKVPSVAHINKKKAEMKFRAVSITYKPEISESTRKKRKSYAKEELKRWPWTLTVVMDQKWFTEEKARKKKVLKRRGSPMKKPFAGKSKETTTQLRKVMYLCAVSPTHGKIGKWKLDWGGHTKVNSKTGAIEPAGIDSAFMEPYWKKIKAAATRVFQRSDGIRIVVDGAPAHKSKRTQAFLMSDSWDSFVEVTLQSPTSPDFNMLDASVFPSLERLCNNEHARTEAEIDKAVAKVWSQLTTAECKKAAAKVKSNMEESVAIDGGNYYME